MEEITPKLIKKSKCGEKGDLGGKGELGTSRF